MKRIVEKTELRTERTERTERTDRTDEPERPLYNSYKDLETYKGPYSDPFDIHVHRFDSVSKLCSICNVCLVNTEISTTSITNAYELDKKYLTEHLKILQSNK
jgi:hypothetical protein